VVQAGVGEKSSHQGLQTTVSMSEDSSVPFTIVAGRLVYPAPSGAAGDNTCFNVGFEPQAWKPESETEAPKKK